MSCAVSKHVVCLRVSLRDTTEIHREPPPGPPLIAPLEVVHCREEDIVSRALSVMMILLGFGGAMLSQWASSAEAAGPHAALLRIEDAIQPSSSHVPNHSH